MNKVLSVIHQTTLQKVSTFL